MAQIFNIQDDKVVISKLALKYLEGSVIHAGSFDIVGNASVQNNLTVKGEIVVDKLTVNNLVTPTQSAGEVGQWFTSTEEELAGKGFQWSSANTITQLSYRQGNVLWTNADLDLQADRSYKIDGLEVLSANQLGGSITKSNIRELGPLKSLSVVGDAELSEFVFVKGGFNRVGIGTDQPNAALSIADSEVEIVLGSPRIGVAEIGTYTNHDLELITDSTARISIKNNGEVVFGDPNSKNAVVRINGTLYTDNIVSDTRIERTSSVEFKQTRDNSIYNKGLVWAGTAGQKSLVLKSDNDRICSSEDFDLAEGKSYSINNKIVVTERSLGDAVSHSKLTTLGELESLTVQGPTTLYGNVSATESVFNLKSAIFANGTQQLIVKPEGIDSDHSIALTVGQADAFYADNNEITLGNKQNTRRPVKVYGSLSVGITNPDPSISLAVNGDFSFANKKFFTGTAIPTTGTFNKGDICWNSNPQESSYIGWVCIIEGTPGEWLPFGAVGRQ